MNPGDVQTEFQQLPQLSWDDWLWRWAGRQGARAPALLARANQLPAHMTDALQLLATIDVLPPLLAQPGADGQPRP